jgi:hypothetical protein
MTSAPVPVPSCERLCSRECRRGLEGAAAAQGADVRPRLFSLLLSPVSQLASCPQGPPSRAPASPPCALARKRSAAPARAGAVETRVPPGGLALRGARSGLQGSGRPAGGAMGLRPSLASPPPASPPPWKAAAAPAR